MNSRVVVITLGIAIALGVILGIFFVIMSRANTPAQCETQQQSGICYVYTHHVMAGFFSVVTTILTAAEICETYGLRMVVLLDEGPYLEKNQSYIAKYNLKKTSKNWFDYYFEQPCYNIPENKQQLIPLSRLRNEVQVAGSVLLSPEQIKANYIFDYPCLDPCPSAEQFARQWARTMKIRPPIMKLQQAFNFSRAQYWIGIHYRGTDKFNGPDGVYEHDAIHYDYKFVLECVDKHIAEFGEHRKIGIFVASDEQPFIQECVKHWPQFLVYYTDSIRADISTSGINPSGKMCETSQDSTECKLYKKLTTTSVHLGMKELSSYKKGQDVLLDVLLLSKCHVFFRSQGNVSDFPRRINPQLSEVSLNQLWLKKKNSLHSGNINKTSGNLKVFSFSLYGQGKKYCLGMIKNVEQIETRFPDWQVWIYMAADVPQETRLKIQQHKNVKIIEVPKGNMIDRFTAIDDPSVDVMLVRDADSRVHERDAACIQEFVSTSHKSFHIIRDHNGHWYKILGGMWGIKRHALTYLGQGTVKTMRALYDQFVKNQETSASYGHDQDFLAQVIYPRLLTQALLVHDEKHKFEIDSSVNRPFPVALSGTDFVGQAYNIDQDGRDVPIFKLDDYAK